MKIVAEFDYRNAKAILNSVHKDLLQETRSVLEDPRTELDLSPGAGQRDLSTQIAQHLVPHGWERERPVFTIPDLRYDLLKGDVPLEVEIGHQRLVYADFFKFLADYSQSRIPAGLMLVTGTPELYGHAWHNSLASTRRKLEAVKFTLFVPILLIAVDP